MKTRRIRTSAALLLAGAFAAALASNGSAGAAPEGLFATVKDQGFAPVVIFEGESGRFANLDAFTHQIFSSETDADGEPIFWSDVLGAGELGIVYGVEHLNARTQSYEFYCSYHWNMTGQLVVAGLPTTN
jgi:plastocyanin